MLSVSVEVLDSAVEPGQDVPVRWEVARSYVDTDLNGAIDAEEVNSLTVVLDVLGGIKNHVEFMPTLNLDSYISPQGNLVGITAVPIPIDAQLGTSYSLWATVENGIGAPIAGKAQSPVVLVGSAVGGGASLSSTAFYQGGYGAPSTQLSNALHVRDTTMRVASSAEFDGDTPFDAWISSGSKVGRVRVWSVNGDVWTIERFTSDLYPNDGNFPAGSLVTLDPIDTLAQQSSITREEMLHYAKSIDGSATQAVDIVYDFIAREAALTELRSNEAITAILPGGSLLLLPTSLPQVLDRAFGGAADIIGNWNRNLPTVVLIHGVNNTAAHMRERGESFARLADGKFNVLAFSWGYVAALSGINNTVGELLGGIGFHVDSDHAKNLRAAVNLNKVLRFLDRSYGLSGLDGSNMVNVVAHSQGTVMTTAALSLNPTVLDPSFEYQIRQVLFMGSNLNDKAEVLFNIFPSQSKPQITNLYSKHDDIVSRVFGLGYDGLKQGVLNSGIDDFDANLLDYGVPSIADTEIVHYGDYGWWTWLETMERETSFIKKGLDHPQGFSGLAADLSRYGAIYTSASADTPSKDIPLGYGLATASSLISPLPPVVNLVRLLLPGGGAATNGDAGGAGSGDLPDLTINQGNYFIAEAVGAVDPDGYIFRADFYRDVNGHGLPNDNDQEYLGTDFHPGNGWKRAIYTADWAVGTYDIIARVFDNGGNPSNIKVATIEIVDPNLPPGPLPAVFDNSQRPHYNIFPHRNGDVSYDPALFNLVPGRMDIWQITPQTGGGFSFATTGDTDTVLGLYDWSNGNRLAVDEDNGTGNNAEITHTLTAGHPYVLIVGSQRGDAGNYGLDVTGANQTITATPIFPAPLYEAAVAESIASQFALDYFKATVPATTTTLNVVLDVGVGLNGWVRIENAAHETLATAFLAGASDDETLMAIDVTPGEDIFVTVAALEGTTGNYTLKLDFGPDEAGLPPTLSALPTGAIRLVPLPAGTFTLANQLVTTGQFRNYVISARQSTGGSYTFETFGDLDTQIGVYDLNLVLLGSDDDTGGGDNARLTVNLDAGQDFIVVVRGEGNDTGDFDLSVVGPAANVKALTISGLASAITSDFTSFSGNNRFFHYEVVAPSNATTLTIQTEVAGGSEALDLSVRVSDADGNILDTADEHGPGVMEEMAVLGITGGKAYVITIYSEDYTIGTGRVHVNFDPNFTAGSGSEFPLNSSFFGDQEAPDVARNSSGQTIAVWRYRGLERVDAQRFNGSGQPIGGQFQINAAPIVAGTSIVPHVAMAANGNFVVLYGDSKYRLFNSNGTPLTTELSVGFSTITGDIAMEPNGRFYIVDGNVDQLVGRLFDAAGSPLSGPTILDDTTDHIFDPSVAADGDGNFIVTWQSKSTAGLITTSDIYALKVDSSGNVIDTGRDTYVQGTLSGRRFDDLDGDGLQDPDEAGFQGVTVLLDANGDGIQNVGEMTQSTNIGGDYTFTNVPQGIYRTVQIAGPVSGPAPSTDDFNRANNSNLGPNWTEKVGDLRIESNQLRGASGAENRSYAIFEPFVGIDQYIIFDVDYTATGVSRTVEVLLAYSDASNYLTIKLQDFTDRVGFKHVVFGHSRYSNWWPRMTGGTSVAQPIPLFTTGRVFAGYDSQSKTLTLGIDANFDGTFETIVTRGGLPFDGLGTKVGIGTYNDVAIDNFSVNANFRVVPPLSTVPTEAFKVAPGFKGISARPAVASHGDGTFVIAFEADPGDGTGRNIYAQRFDTNANPDGDLVLVNAVLSGNQIDPSVGLLSQGKYLVAWTGTAANAEGIRAQQLGVNLERLGPEFTLNQTQTGTQQNVALASDENEHLIAVWEGPDASQAGVYGLDFVLAEIKEPELTVTDTRGASSDRFVDFGDGTESGFMPATITVKNDGNAPLIVNHVDIYGADAAAFELSDSSAFTLNPGQSRNLDVTFIGTGVGEHYAAVHLDHNDNADVLSGDFDADAYWLSLLATNAPPLAGDYNGNERVDTADYVVWRNMLNQSVRPYSGADGSGNGIVGAEDYGVWRANFGNILPPGTGSSAVVIKQQPAEESGTTINEQSQEVVALSTAGQDNSSLQSTIALAAPVVDALESRDGKRDVKGFVIRLAVDLPLSQGPSVESRLGDVGVRNSRTSYTAHRDASLLAWILSFDRDEPQPAILESVRALTNDEDVLRRLADERLIPGFHAVDRAFDDIGSEL